MLNQDIIKLDLESNLIQKLKNSNVNIVQDLWQLKRNNLKKMGLNDSDLNQIMIKMQLHGIDLNRKVYKRQ